MVQPRLVATTGGAVEVLHVPGERPPVLFFPGGHSRAQTDCGWSLYAELGHEVVSFSRPGYGSTRVGRLSAAEFAPLVDEVCARLGVSGVAAVVGVSFGGLQAVHVAAGRRPVPQRLILHSCAPSGLSYPDSKAEAVLGPIVFSPQLQGLVWWALHAAVRSDAGLRAMMAPLSTLPVDEWWSVMTPADRETTRALFRSMRSDAGFATDLRQGRPADAGSRREAISRVPCRTLITASRSDGGVAFAHAEDFARTIPDAELVELDSPTHLFWIGPQRATLLSLLGSFIEN